MNKEELKKVIKFERSLNSSDGREFESLRGDLTLTVIRPFVSDFGSDIDPDAMESSGKTMREIFEDRIVDMMLIEIGKIKIEPAVLSKEPLSANSEILGDLTFKKVDPGDEIILSHSPDNFAGPTDEELKSGVMRRGGKAYRVTPPLGKWKTIKGAIDEMNGYTAEEEAAADKLLEDHDREDNPEKFERKNGITLRDAVNDFDNTASEEEKQNLKEFYRGHNHE